MSVSMNFSLIPLIIALIVNAVLAVLVYKNKPTSATNRIFVTLSFVISLWLVVMNMAISPSFYSHALLLTRTTVFLATPMSLFFFVLSHTLPSPKLLLSRKVCIALFISTVFVMLLTLSPFVFTDVQVVNGALVQYTGPGMVFFSIFTTFFSVAAIVVLISKMRKSIGVEKSQVQFVFLGIVLMLSLIITTIMIPVMLFQNDVFVPFAPLYALTFLGMTGYAIFKHGLFDVKVIITRSLMFSLLTIVISGLFTSGTLLSNLLIDVSNVRSVIMVNTIVAVIVIVFLQPLRNFFARITDSIFYKGQIDHQKVANDMSKVIARTLERDELLFKFAKGLTKQLKIKKVDILFCQKDVQACFLYYSHQPQLHTELHKGVQRHLWNEYSYLINFFTQYTQVKIRESVASKIEHMKPSVYLNRVRKLVQYLSDRSIGAVIPVVSHPNERVFVMIGNRSSGDLYTIRDMRLFELLQSQLASALDKSSLYEEVKAFNVKLKKEIQQATTELKDANKHLRELDKAKTLFLSVASHQLRTPLTGIKGFLSMVLDGDYGKPSKHISPVLEEVYSNTNRLIRLVNTFLNVSRIETGRLTMIVENYDVMLLARRVVGELQFNAHDHGISLALESDKEKIFAHIDVDKLEDVLINLTDNAIKYTEKGGVTVRVIDKVKTVRFEVEDTGQGLKREEIETLFNKFVRGQRALKVQTDGSGLGLYIAKRVIDMHNGKIGVDSPGVGKGSTFWFEVPKK